MLCALGKKQIKEKSITSCSGVLISANIIFLGSGTILTRSFRTFWVDGPLTLTTAIAEGNDPLERAYIV